MNVQMVKILLSSIGLSFFPICEAQEIKNVESYERIKSVIENCRDISSQDKDNAIRNLSFLLLKLSAEKSSVSIERLNDLYKEAQSALVAIPGHAEYQLKRINIARGKLKPDATFPIKEGSESFLTDSDFSAISPFEVLSRLPSHETVSVLGLLINVDETTGDRTMLRHLSDSSESIPYGQLAALAMGCLIEDPPVSMGPGFIYARDIKLWRAWFEDVKAGNRTFRFKGGQPETAIEKE